jgi:Flp pilus assembly pilin Flp
VGGIRVLGERGASLVEYALIVAVCGIGALVAMQALADTAAERFEYQATSAGEELDGGSGGGGGGSDSPDPGSGTDGEAPPFTGVVTSCSGMSCTFGVLGAASGATFSWTVDPGGASGTGPTFAPPAFTLEQPGNKDRLLTITLTASPSGDQSTTTVLCSRSGPTESCALVR